MTLGYLMAGTLMKRGAVVIGQNRLGFVCPSWGFEINVFRESLFTDPLGRGFESRLYLWVWIADATAGQLRRLWFTSALATGSQRFE